MLDFNILYAVLIAIAVVIFVKFGKPYLKKNNIDFYEEIKLFLLVSGYAFRDEKIKAIAGLSLNVVKKLEELTLVSDEKHYLAVDKIFRELLEELDVEIDESVIEGIVRIAVSHLPATTQK